MNDTREQILASARTYVTDLITHKLDPQFVFHNLDHTEDVAAACSQMSEKAGLKEEDHFVLMLAAWFHDTGYIKGTSNGWHLQSKQPVCRSRL
jgi:HD superfamily phosphodiesterase